MGTIKRKNGNGGDGVVIHTTKDGIRWREGDPDRRRPGGEEERERYRAAHDIHRTAAATEDDAKSWRNFVPKPVLWALLTLAFLVVSWFVKDWAERFVTWRSDVSSFVETSKPRLESMERGVLAMAEEFRDFRIERIEEQLWLAERRGDAEAVRYFSRQLGKLKNAEMQRKQ